MDGYERLEDARAEFTAKENATIGGVLGPLIQMSFRDRAENIIWPIETFLSGDRPDTPASLVADLTGGGADSVLRPLLLFAFGLLEGEDDRGLLSRRSADAFLC